MAARLVAAIRERVPEAYRDTFGGTVVMDANDIGRNVLGKDAPGPKERYEAMFADNPLGQGSEQTPMAIVFETAFRLRPQPRRGGGAVRAPSPSRRGGWSARRCS